MDKKKAKILTLKGVDRRNEPAKETRTERKTWGKKNESNGKKELELEETRRRKGSSLGRKSIN